MASLTIRQLDDETKARLRLQAARNGRSMEDEARTILRQAAAMQTGQPSAATDPLSPAPATRSVAKQEPKQSHRTRRAVRCGCC